MSLQFPAEAEMENRLDAVLTTLYLLFSEGYYSESQEAVLREDLCWEAIRLTQLLVDHPRTNLPAVQALLALMYFHASRFAARKDASGALILYQDQDQAQWDQALIAQGALHLRRAATESRLNKYHLEAAIAYWHTVKADSSEKWEAILQLYNQLLILEYSPIAALNRTYALSRVKGKEAAIGEAQRLKLDNNPYYFTLLGELYREVNAVEAKSNYQKAFRLAKTSHDKQMIQAKLDQLP